MTDTTSFSKLVPGFDFLQGLVKNAGAALPGIGQWVAPTLDPDALDKRIEELRTVQFWLEQNARMLGATIQALEVQKMTLTTLRTMNVQMSDLHESLRINLPETAAAPAPAPAARRSTQQDAGAGAPKGDGAASGEGKPAVDPMQWWGALTKQFTQLATTAMEESQGMAAAMGRRSFDGVEPPASGSGAGEDKPAADAADAADADGGDAADSAADARSAPRKSGAARKRAATGSAAEKGAGR